MRLIDFIKHYWLLITLFILITITALSLWPVTQLPIVPGTDKSHHFFAYGALILPLALRKPTHWLWIAFSFIVFSGLIELIQPYVNRYGEWLDMAANLAGLVCGIIIASIIDFYYQQAKNKI
jgi:VanZ family protein